MNLDGTATVDAVTEVGARVAYLTPLALALLALGALCAVTAVAAFRTRALNAAPAPCHRPPPTTGTRSPSTSTPTAFPDAGCGW